jgi:hypothetical protein
MTPIVLAARVAGALYQVAFGGADELGSRRRMTDCADEVRTRLRGHYCHVNRKGEYFLRTERTLTLTLSTLATIGIPHSVRDKTDSLARDEQS